MLLLTFRLEFSQLWETKSYHSQIMLNRLTMFESMKMASHLLGACGIDGALETWIHDKSEGVPFFIEELIK